MPTEKSIRTPKKSFVLRIWNDGESDSEMRGEIENIATGERRMFADEWSLLKLLETWRRDLGSAV